MFKFIKFYKMASTINFMDDKMTTDDAMVGNAIC